MGHVGRLSGTSRMSATAGSNSVLKSPEFATIEPPNRK